MDLDAHIEPASPSGQAHVDQVHAEAIDALKRATSWMVAGVFPGDDGELVVFSLSGGGGTLAEFLRVAYAADLVSTRIKTLSFGEAARRLAQDGPVE